jgi:hypothetical protein
MEDPLKLGELAIWYREFAERADNPAIWEARLKTSKIWNARPTAWKRWRPGAR